MAGPDPFPRELTIGIKAPGECEPALQPADLYTPTAEARMLGVYTLNRDPGANDMKYTLAYGVLLLLLAG